MLTGLSGSLVTHSFAERLLHLQFAGHLGEHSCADAHRKLRRWWSEQGSQLGPTSSVRSIWNTTAAGLAEQLGFAISNIDQNQGHTRAALLTSMDARVGVLAGHWTEPLDTLWRDAVRNGIGLQTSWSLCTNGHQLRLID